MKTEKTNKLRGTVLFTVVAVMALLIIFLTGTLALATASSNRAHKSYSSSQASYTAKTAITGFTRAMETSEEIRNKIVSLGIDENPAVIHPSLTFREGTDQDRTIGLVGYWDESGVWHDNQITVERVMMQDPSDPTNPDAQVVKTEWMYTWDDDGNGKWVETEKVRITATARVGREESTVTAYLTKMPGEGELTEEIHNHKSNSGGIKGLNTVGEGVFHNGGRYTGGMGIGLTGDGFKNGKRIQYVLDNAVELDTTLTFINGNVACKTTNFSINVNDAADIPVSQTVINGSLYLQNKDFVELAYTMDHDYTQKQIPYLYVDDALYLEDGGYVVNYKGENKTFSSHESGLASPYNVFCGTLYTEKNDVLFHSDVYMMDEYQAGSYYELKDGNGNDKNNVVVKGNNYFGRTNGNQLYKWTSDLVDPDTNKVVQNKTASQNSSVGGSIFCNGNLTLGGSQIDGDVRVVGDCVITGTTHIYGNLVVGDHLTVSGGSLTVDGYVYCDSGKITGYSADGSDTQAPTYKRVDNVYVGPEEYKPAEGEDPQSKWSDLRIMDCAKREWVRWNPYEHQNSSWQPTEITGETATENIAIRYYRYDVNYCKGITVGIKGDDYRYIYPGDEYDAADYDEVRGVDDILAELFAGSKTFDDPLTKAVAEKWIDLEHVDNSWDQSREPYNCKIIAELNSAGEVTYRETSEPCNYSQVLIDPITGEILEDEVPHFNKADFNGNQKDPVENVGAQLYTYYNEQNQQEVSETTALAPPPEPVEGDKIQSLDKFKEVYKDEIYPAHMTREAIYGSYTGTEFDNQFVPANDTYKIIKNIREVRVDLGMTEAGGYDDYPSDLTSVAGATTAAFLATNDAVAFENDEKKNTGADKGIWTGDVITGSCVIKGSVDSKTIEINPQGKEICIVLDGVTANGSQILVDRFYKAEGETIPTECGKVKFFIKGTLHMKLTGGIVNKKIVTEEPLEIDMYSSPRKNTDFGMEFYGEEDSFILLNNYNTLSGTFKCPYTDFQCDNHGAFKVKYRDEYGEWWSDREAGQERGKDQTGGKPVLIGNALFHDVLETQNDFGLYYTETGQIGNSGDGDGDGDEVTTRVIRAATGEKWFFEFYSAT